MDNQKEGFVLIVNCVDTFKIDVILLTSLFESRNYIVESIDELAKYSFSTSDQSNIIVILLGYGNEEDIFIDKNRTTVTSYLDIYRLFDECEKVLILSETIWEYIDQNTKRFVNEYIFEPKGVYHINLMVNLENNTSILEKCLTSEFAKAQNLFTWDAIYDSIQAKMEQTHQFASLKLYMTGDVENYIKNVWYQNY